MREQLSRLILAAAISNAIDYFFSPRVSYFDELSCKNQKHLRLSSAACVTCFMIAGSQYLKKKKKKVLWMASWQQKTTKNDIKRQIQLSPFMWCWADLPPWNRERELARDCGLCEMQWEKEPCCWSAKQIRSWYLKSGVVIANHSTAVF